MTGKRRILITGMSGLIGNLVGPELGQRYDVRALNRRAVPAVDTVQADICDLEAIAPAFRDVDTVLHLAAYLGPDDSRHLAVNVLGTYNVFEAARRAGVQRLIFASSGAVMGGYGKDEPFRSFIEGPSDETTRERPLVTHLHAVRPTTLYGATKVWGEALGRYYSEAHGMHVVCIRLGRVIASDEPEDAVRASVHLSHRDTVQVITKSIEAVPKLRYEILHAVSDNINRVRDIGHAREAVGFVPQDGVTRLP